jgi:hypothetical protein
MAAARPIQSHGEVAALADTSNPEDWLSGFLTGLRNLEDGRYSPKKVGLTLKLSNYDGISRQYCSDGRVGYGKLDAVDRKLYFAEP